MKKQFKEHTLESARELVIKFVSLNGGDVDDVVINPSSPKEYPFGWLFNFTTLEFIESKGTKGLAGGCFGPLFFSRLTGRVWAYTPLACTIIDELIESHNTLYVIERKLAPFCWMTGCHSWSQPQ